MGWNWHDPPGMRMSEFDRHFGSGCELCGLEPADEDELRLAWIRGRELLVCEKCIWEEELNWDRDEER